MNKELKITPPEGYEIDKEKSTLEHIVFKPVDKKAKTWEEIQELNFKNHKKQFYVSWDGEIDDFPPYEKALTLNTLNHVNTQRQAEKIRALCQLYIIADYYNNGWEADWNDMDEKKYSPLWDIKEKRFTPLSTWWMVGSNPVFKSAEILLEAYENNKEIFETALKP